MASKGTDKIREFFRHLQSEHGYSWQRIADEVNLHSGLEISLYTLRNFAKEGRQPQKGLEALKAFRSYMNKKAPEVGADLEDWRQTVFCRTTDVLRELVDDCHHRHACDLVDITGSYRGFKGSAFSVSTCAFQLDIDNVDEALVFESLENNPRYYRHVPQDDLDAALAEWDDEQSVAVWASSEELARSRGHLAGSFKMNGLCGRHGENFQLVGGDGGSFRCFMQLRAVARQNSCPLILKGFEVLTDDRSLLSISKVYCARIRREEIGAGVDQDEDLMDRAMEYLAVMDNQVLWDERLRAANPRDRSINAVFCGHGGSSYGEEINNELFEHFYRQPAHLIYQNRPEGQAARTDDQISTLQIFKGLETMMKKSA